MRLPTLLVPLLAAATALAADEQAVRAPYVERGDCWSYHAEGLNYRGPIDDYELCATFVDLAKNVILAVATVKSDGREIDTSSTAEWNPVTTVGGVIDTPAAKFFKFPLHVGDAYPAEYEFREVLKGSNAGKHDFKMKVAGWEEVTVPAGTFRALRLDGESVSQRYDRRINYMATMTVWYVPAVNRYVKYRFATPLFEIREELTGYRLNK